jgi:hypothetical protein
MTSPTVLQHDSDRHLVWPAARFYFALLDASALPTSERITEERLRYLLEAELPEPLDDIHAIFRPVGPRRWLACALPRAELARDLPETAITLVPDSIPDPFRSASETPIAPADLQLLVGDYEPKPVRLARRRTLVAAAAASALALAALLLGFERRIASELGRAEQQRVERSDLVARALGPPSAQQPLPPELRLVAELRALRQTRRQADSVVSVRDVSDVLIDLLARWPRDLPTRTDALIVSEGAVHARGSVAESDHAQAIATATTGLAGFTEAFPSVQTTPDGWRFALEWRANKSTSTSPGGR